VKLPVPGLSLEQQPPEILLAMLVWGEARGKPPTDDAAVAWTAKNRSIRSGRPIAREILKPWAYSCFNDEAHEGEREKMLDPCAHDSVAAWANALAIAEGVMAGSIPDPTDGATHYVVERLWNNPTPAGHRIQWYHQAEIESGRTEKTVQLGPHVFARAA
jgi:spore germination cell wall hydrolase CwlJ-like protein